MASINGGQSWLTAHQKEVRAVLLALGIASAAATPFLVAKAQDECKKRFIEEGAETKEDKIRIIRKNPWTWAAVGTTLTSLGTGIATYGLTNKIIASAESTINDMADKIDVTNKAISKLPEKEKDKVEKAVAEETFKQAAKKAEAGDGERCLGTAGVPVDTGYGDTLFFDCWTKTWFLSDYNKIMSVINEINANLNEGVVQRVSDWCIKNGWSPKELDYDYYFTSQIALLKDGDHFYMMDDKGVPLGLLEFKASCKPEHIPPERAKGLPFV